MENYNEVSIGDRKFRIKKFNARTGSFMLLKITGLLAPLAKKVDWKKLTAAGEASDPTDINTDGLNIIGIAEELGNLSEKDFTYIQEQCLRVCSEVLPAGLAPVLQENGSFGVTGLEDDTMVVMALTVHALVFNVKGFFQGSPLGSLVGGLLNTSPRD